MSEIIWHKKETPTEIGTHFVAVKYGEGAGSFDLIEWDGEKWLTEFNGTVIAYLTLGELMKNISFEWPEDCNRTPNKPKPSSKPESRWEEV
jgi:hypothetical protein